MKKLLYAFLLIITIFATVACGNETVAYDVYVTVYPLQYVTEEILKDTSLTVGIVPGVSSHQDSVDWSPKEIIAMRSATLLFYVGANYDQYIDLQVESIFVDEGVELVKIENETNYIQFIPGIIDDHDHNTETTASKVLTEADTLGLDPHFWISPIRMMQVAKLIYDRLVLKYPMMLTTLASNYNQLIDNLTTLSLDFEQVLLNQSNVAMFSTNLFGYLREDYGLQYISISPGYHEETEQFTTQEKEEIVNDAILYNIKYIIYERYTSSPLSNAVFTDLTFLGYEPIKLEYDILQSLTDDERSLGEDYISIMTANLELLKLAVGYIEE
jgi:zinc transport system substrate-binding protein